MPKSKKKRRNKRASSTNGVVRFNMELPDELYDWTKAFASEAKTSMAKVIRESLEEKRSAEARKKRVVAFLTGGDGVEQI